MATRMCTRNRRPSLLSVRKQQAGRSEGNVPKSNEYNPYTGRCMRCPNRFPKPLLKHYTELLLAGRWLPQQTTNAGFSPGS